MIVHILGTPYELIECDLSDDSLFGYTDYCDKTIKISDKIPNDSQKQRIIRHEVAHAFLYESGLDLAYNETIVDWLAIQLPKMVDAVNEAQYGK